MQRPRIVFTASFAAVLLSIIVRLTAEKDSKFCCATRPQEASWSVIDIQEIFKWHWLYRLSWILLFGQLVVYHTRTKSVPFTWNDLVLALYSSWHREAN